MKRVRRQLNVFDRIEEQRSVRTNHPVKQSTDVSTRLSRERERERAHTATCYATLYDISLLSSFIISYHTIPYHTIPYHTYLSSRSNIRSVQYLSLRSAAEVISRTFFAASSAADFIAFSNLRLLSREPKRDFTGGQASRGRNKERL